MEKQTLFELIMAARNKSFDAEISIGNGDLMGAAQRLGEGAGLMQFASTAALILEEQTRKGETEALK